MGLFDKFKKKQPQQEVPEQEMPEPISNDPLPLMVKLFFTERPVINTTSILDEVKLRYPQTILAEEGEAKFVHFRFPDCDTGVDVEGIRLVPVCVIQPMEGKDALTLPPQAYQQNWEWKEGAEVTAGCNYVLMVHDMMTGLMEYRVRHELYMTFLAAVIRATGPVSMYSLSAEKLVDPAKIAMLWEQRVQRNTCVLEAVMNVRLFNIEGTVANDIVMDTLGLNRLGLPDLQIRFTGGQDVNAIAYLLWNYAYYIADNGDIIEDGNTINGPGGEAWMCHHLTSLVGPERVVLNIMTE